MMSFAVLFTNFEFDGLTRNSRFGFDKYNFVLETESCKITGLMFS